MKESQSSPMSCDIELGVCQLQDDKNEVAASNYIKPVRLLYFTDPICSTCWGIEPQLRKLKQEYGDYFSIEYRMGGLLKSWGEYGGSDVKGPASVAQHWDEVSAIYEMPIDGDIWKEDPLTSSYPPSIAFKAAQMQGEEKAELFLRRIREMVFIEKKNITRQEHLVAAAQESGLDVVQFNADNSKAAELFALDLKMAKEWNVKGFPTIFFQDAEENQFKVYGNKPYAVFEQALKKLIPDAKPKAAPDSYETALNGYGTLTTKEFALLNNKNQQEAEAILDNMEKQNQVEKTEIKNGALWRKIV